MPVLPHRIPAPAATAVLLIVPRPAHWMAASARPQTARTSRPFLALSKRLTTFPGDGHSLGL
jgi:hypothetical protein